MSDIEQLNTGKWAYTIIDKEIYFKYLGNKDKTNLGYSLHFDWAEPKEQPMRGIKDRIAFILVAFPLFLFRVLIIPVRLLGYTVEVNMYKD